MRVDACRQLCALGIRKRKLAEGSALHFHIRRVYGLKTFRQIDIAETNAAERRFRHRKQPGGLANLSRDVAEVQIVESGDIGMHMMDAAEFKCVNYDI